MDDRQIRVRLWTLLVATTVAVVLWLPAASFAGRGHPPAPTLEVHFLDVGQGDATLIETPEGVQVLIDGGPDGSVLRALGQVMPWWDRSIDIVVATHPDGDHIGGLVDVLERYQVATILHTGVTSDTPTSAAYEAAVAAEGVPVVTVQAGDVLQLGASTTLRVLFPETAVADTDSNATSLVTQLTYGTSDFLLTGDAPDEVEFYLVDRFGDQLQSEVLKVGHHGSKTSTADSFVSTVAPGVAVISTGAGNRYGHPHAEVLEALEGVEILGTYEVGTISFATDGVALWRKK